MSKRSHLTKKAGMGGRKIMKRAVVLIIGLVFCAGLTVAGPIHEAIENGDLDQIKAILSDNPDKVNEKDASNNTPLHLAALQGNLGIVKMLVDKGADINLGDNENSPPIVNAALRNHPEIVKYMLDHGASATLKDDNQMTPMHFAAMGGDTQIMQMLLDKGAEADAANSSGVTPLVYAAYRGKMDAIRLLVEKGADLNAKTQGGEGLIHAAANFGSVEEMEFFVNHGADVNARDNDDETPLFDAAGRGRLDATKWLLEHGADARKLNIHGESPLLLSVFSNIPELVDTLINAGADPNQTTGYGQMPLHYATYRNSLESARTLIAHGANPNLTNRAGETPFYTAVKRGQTEICQLMLEEDVDLRIRENSNGRTPLHIGCIKGYADIVDRLIVAGAEVNAMDNFGRTPLYYTGKYGHKQAADMLLAKGGEAENMERNFGKSPQLKKSLAEQDAVVWYTGHSGWAVKTKNHFLVFDYWGGESTPTDPGISNGYINPSEIGDIPTTVFVSHVHGDHYDPAIWGWRQSMPNITYVMGFEPDSAEGYDYLPPRSQKTYDGVKVSTIESNDTGVGFLVEVDGLVIFHSGDHANRQRDFSGPFKAEIDYLAAMDKPIDLAFMPISGCGFGDLEAVKLGVYYTLETLQPKLIFPSHALDSEFRYREFADEAAGEKFKSKFICAENKGDRFEYQSGSVAF